MNLRRIAWAFIALPFSSVLLFAGACSDHGDSAITTLTPDAATDDGGAPGSEGGAEASVDAGDASADAGDAAASFCPAGSTIRKVATSCPGAPLAPPASFASDLTAANVGDVVSMAGMDPSAAPCLPVVVCTPGDAATLLFSDSPEMPSQDGVLYADTVNAGNYRLYVYHANGDTAVRKFPVVVLNQGAADAKVTIVRRGLAAPSTAYVSVGKTVLLDWFVDRAPVLLTVAAGQRVLLDDALDALHATQNQLVHAIYDITVDHPVKISFVSVLANADAAATTAGLSLLPRDGAHQRGTFPAADVIVTATPNAQQKGVQRLQLGLDEVDDTLTGTDATTGDAQKLSGNYGLFYRLPLGLPLPALLAIAPRGGGWGGVSHVTSGSTALPTASEQLDSTTDAIALGPSGGDAGAAGASGDLMMATGGGSNLPVDLVILTP